MVCEHNNHRQNFRYFSVEDENLKLTRTVG